MVARKLSRQPPPKSRCFLTPPLFKSSIEPSATSYQSIDDSRSLDPSHHPEHNVLTRLWGEKCKNSLLWTLKKCSCWDVPDPFLPTARGASEKRSSQVFASSWCGEQEVFLCCSPPEPWFLHIASTMARPLPARAVPRAFPATPTCQRTTSRSLISAWSTHPVAASLIAMVFSIFAGGPNTCASRP